MKSNTLFLSAGEVSGDIHAADLIIKLRELDPGLKFTGIGGVNMHSAGLVPITGDVSTLNTMGLVDSLRFYFRNYGTFRLCRSYLKENEIKYLVMIDNQGFNIPLAKFAKKLGIKTIYYFPPHVSIWGGWNARIVAENVDLIISPFYSDYLVYKKYTEKAVFSGHPLLDKIDIKADKEEICRKYGLDVDKKIVSIMPGSRYQEIENLTDPMLAAAGILAKEYGIQIILPVSHPDFKEFILKRIKKYGLENNIRVIEKDSYNAMSVADVNILASGTASLESALLRKPPVICYKISGSSFLIGKLLFHIKMIGLPNILLKRKVFPELLQKECNAGNMVREALLFLNSDKKDLEPLYDEIKSSLGQKPVVDRAAGFIIKELRDA